jgi:hypothetical protein
LRGERARASMCVLDAWGDVIHLAIRQTQNQNALRPERAYGD